MNKIIFVAALLIISGAIFTSCGDSTEEPPQPITIIGTWRVTERILSTGNQDVDTWINGALKEDHWQYEIRKVFSGIDGKETVGSLVTTMNKKNAGADVDDEKWLGTYEIEDDQLHVDEERLHQSVSTIEFSGSQTMTTHTEITATYLRNLLSVLKVYGQDDRVPDDITGSLKTTHIR